MRNLSIIAAIGENNELGKDNHLLWHISNDLKRFKSLTMGQTIIMGRKTFESLKNGALPNRRNIVLTNNSSFQRDNIETANSVDEVFALINPDEEAFIIGGEAIYKLFLPYTQKLYLTKVHKSYDADAFFPTININEWKETERIDINEDVQAGVNYSYITLEHIIMNDIIADIRNALEDNIDIKTQESSQRYFREKIKCYGVKVAVVNDISKKYFKTLKSKSKTQIFDLCDELWQSGYIEESFIACNWSYYIRKQFELADFKIFEEWINNYISNWASCDSFCNHTVGAFIEMYPEFISILKVLANSENKWARRAAAVSLVLPARKGKFLKDIFEIADILLLDKEDLVQKGYGWLLKEASKAYQQEVFNYVIRNKKTMRRTALRYAIEKMPQDLRIQAMEK